MATDTAVFHGISPPRLSAEDFETASIRSAAPSYVSEAPSYHTLPPNEVLPAYTSSATTSSQASRPSHSTTRQYTSMLPPRTEPWGSFTPGAGLPPIPRRSESSSTPSLSQFHIAPWSSISSGNPQARHYQSVASRRVAAAASSAGPSSSSSVEGALRAALSRIQAANAAAISEEDDSLVRPLEDPYLVGEEAAARARSERLARKHGEDILIHEDRHWDLWLAQMRNTELREPNWNGFRVNNGRPTNRRRFTRRFGLLT